MANSKLTEGLPELLPSINSPLMILDNLIVYFFLLLTDGSFILIAFM